MPDSPTESSQAHPSPDTQAQSLAPAASPPPILEQLGEVDGMIEQMQQAIRAYAEQLDEYVTEQQRQQELAAQRLREQIVEEFQDRREQLDHDQQQLEADRKQFEADRTDLDQQIAAYQQRIKQAENREMRLDQQANTQVQRQEQLDQAEQDLTAARAAVDSRESDLNERRQQLDDRAEELEGKANDLAAARRQIQQRHEELNQRAAKLEKRQADFKATADRVTAELRQQREQFEAEARTRREQFEAEAQAQRDRIEAEAQAQQAQLEAEAKARREQFEAEADQRNKALVHRERKADHRDQELADRRAKLHQYKDILEKRSTRLRESEAAVEKTRAAASRIVAQRKTIQKRQQELAETETQMIRRWGVQHALGWATAAAVCLAMLAGLSWFVSAPLADRTYVATAVVQHDRDTAKAADWADQQVAQITSGPNIDQAVTVMRQIGYTGPASPEHIRQLLAGMSVHSPTAGVMNLELRGSDNSELVPVLGGLLRSHVATVEEANPDADPAILQGATLAAEPAEDNRVAVAAQVMGGTTGVSLVVFTLAMFYLTRTRTPVAVVDAPADSAVDWDADAARIGAGAAVDGDAADDDDDDDAVMDELSLTDDSNDGDQAPQTRPAAGEAAAPPKQPAQPKPKRRKPGMPIGAGAPVISPEEAGDDHADENDRTIVTDTLAPQDADQPDETPQAQTAGQAESDAEADAIDPLDMGEVADDEADPNAQTVVDSHPALDFSDVADEPKASTQPADDEADADGEDPEFKPL